MNSDYKKFEEARNFDIKKLEKVYIDLMDSKVKIENQLGVVLYLLDKTAYRVGSEDNKESGFGMRSLLQKHIKLDDTTRKIKFDFSGKDEVQYKKDHVVEEQVFSLMEGFYDNNKEKEIDPIFDKLKYNKVLSFFKDNFQTIPTTIRTYHASICFEETLKEKNSISEAKTEAQLLLNHQDQESLKYYIDPRIILAW